MSALQIALVGAGVGLVVGLVMALIVMPIAMNPAIKKESAGGTAKGAQMLRTYQFAGPLLFAAVGAFGALKLFGGTA